jgi:eukaryotic-like serine/threonine-protein kinase
MDVGHTIAARYRLLERLGAGGMSVVWRASDAVLGREVAVKVLTADVAADPALLHQLYAEARAAAGLRHANVVEVYDYGEASGLPYVVMELVAGRPVNALLSAGPLPWRVAVLIAAQVAAALAAAHARGVVHRDVKPANVMVTANGVKLVDFGISAAVGDRDSDPGLVLGTPAYLAPERLAGGLVRPATDVYALGLLLYMMVAGRLPWRASTTTEMLRAHWYQEPAPLPPVPEMPAEVAELCRQCLAKAPGDRPSAEAAANALAGIAGLPLASPLSALFGGEAGEDALATPAAPEPDERRTAAVSAVPPVGRAETAAARPGSTHPGPTRPASQRLDFRRPAVRRTAIATATALLVTGPGLAWWLSRPDPHTPAAAAGPRPSATAAPIRCTVRYAVQDVSGGRASTAVTVVNDGSAAVGRWRLAFRLPTGQHLIHGSNAIWHQSGADVRADGTALAPGHPLETTFEASYSDATTLPDTFTLNGVACRSDLSLRGRTTPPAPVTVATRAAPPKPVIEDKPGEGPGNDNKGKDKDKDKGKGKP